MFSVLQINLHIAVEIGSNKRGFIVEPELQGFEQIVWSATARNPDTG